MRDLLNLCGFLLAVAVTLGAVGVCLLVAAWCVRKIYRLLLRP